MQLSTTTGICCPELWRQEMRRRDEMMMMKMMLIKTASKVVMIIISKKGTNIYSNIHLAALYICICIVDVS